MTEETKYLIFKGIEKKEQIVLKSFLNLAKNELKYQIVVLKDNVDSEHQPSILVVGDGYEFPDDESDLKSLPQIVLGDDLENEWEGYITRPIQWSDFRPALSQFSEPTVRPSESVVSDSPNADVVENQPVLELTSDMAIDDDGVASVDDDDISRVLPSEAMFAIDDVDDEPTKVKTEDDFEPVNHEFELDNMSVDYASHTNSDYMKVVDDVQQFKVDEGDQPSAMLLVTDDESNSTNSVLVIETNSLDAWDFSVTESSEVSVDAAAAVDEVSLDMAEALEEGVKKPAVKQKSGFDLAPGEKYWQEDNEIIAGDISVLYIKTQRNMVYSAKEPGMWVKALQDKKLTKLPLSDDWRPKKGLTAYPLDQLVWVNSLVNNSDKLAEGLSDDALYILEKWPHFDLLQLDNVLLKLCSMLFVKPESLGSLVEKSGYSRSTVRGLMNACYEGGILKESGEVQIENLVAAGNDGVFGKIKDVFR